MVSNDTIYWFNITIIEWMIYRLKSGLISNNEFIKVITECRDEIKVFCKRDINPNHTKAIL